MFVTFCGGSVVGQIRYIFSVLANINVSNSLLISLCFSFCLKSKTKETWTLLRLTFPHELTYQCLLSFSSEGNLWSGCMSAACLHISPLWLTLRFIKCNNRAALLQRVDIDPSPQGGALRWTCLTDLITFLNRVLSKDLMENKTINKYYDISLNCWTRSNWCFSDLLRRKIKYLCSWFPKTKDPVN